MNWFTSAVVFGQKHTFYKQKTGALILASKVIYKENIDKTKYMVMSQDQNTGRSHNSCFNKVEQIKY
jgi:hypothetical protein